MKREEVESTVLTMNPQPDLRGEWFSFIPYEDHKFSPYVHFSCRIDHKKGVMQVCGWTQNIKSNPNGAELFSLFSHLKSEQDGNFKQGKLIEGFTTPIPRYKADTEFLMAMSKGERILACEYHKDYGSEMPEGLEMVQIQAFGRDEYSGNVMIKYFWG
ncbi:MAG: hypothetical protein KBT11_09485 [Treponema sp.]|nr:hypothetical protein [Candidatus Treponema equifaecale]